MFRFGDPGGRLYQTLGTSNANLLAWWTSLVSLGSTLAISSGNGRLAGSCLRISCNGSANNYCYVQKVLDQQPTWGISFGLRISALPQFRTEILALADATTVQVGLFLLTDGTLQIERGGGVAALAGGTVIGGPTAAAIPLNAWQHIEIKVTINNTTGSIALYRNGVAVIGPTSSLNTRSSTNNSANTIYMGYVGIPSNNGALSGTIDLDDIIAYDGQTTDALGNADITGPIGDCRLALVPPSGAGAVTQFTALGTSPNYNCLIDANGPDGDSTCVQSGTVGQTDTYTTAGLPAYATVVKAVAVVEYARKTDAGVRTLSPVIRSGGGNSVHPTANALGTNYQYFFNNWGQNPNNGSPTAWTQAGVNAIEIGQQVSG